jgi:hypothetical protein
MASKVYPSIYYDAFTAALGGDLTAVDVYCMLVTSAYTFDPDHSKRSEITNEVTHAAYTAGGKKITVTATKDTANDRVDLTLATVNWAAVTITARAAVYYVKKGGASSADLLIMYDDFGADITATNDTFTVGQSILRTPVN